MKGIKQSLFPAGNFTGKLSLLLTDEVRILHILHDLLIRNVLFHHRHRNFRRADSGQGSPGKLPAGMLGKCCVNQFF